ncbi:hypothetical protein [Bacteroides sp.]|uniref:hypothetical protein n=1 Tax=Bacteroides sp. TaxID=29523 RepID=UPI003AB3DB22
MTATAPPTDRPPSDFLEGAQFAVCPIGRGSNGHGSKKKKEQLTDEASEFRFVCKPFLSFDFPSVACFRCRMPYERMVGRGKVFGQNTLRRRKILLETALPLDLASAIKPCATFASEHRKRVSDGMNSIIPSVSSSVIRNK